MKPQGVLVREVIETVSVRRKAREKFFHPLVRAGYLRAERSGPARRYFLLLNEWDYARAREEVLRLVSA